MGVYAIGINYHSHTLWQGNISRVGQDTFRIKQFGTADGSISMKTANIQIGLVKWKSSIVNPSTIVIVCLSQVLCSSNATICLAFYDSCMTLPFSVRVILLMEEILHQLIL